MNTEIKERWVAALESGNYKQGTLFLKRSGAHCCLGVLCEVMGVEFYPVNGEDMYTLVPDSNDSVRTVYSGSLTNDVHERSGLTSDDTGTLARMNDHEGRSFKQIAQYIRENL